jgi:YggT family protein
VLILVFLIKLAIQILVVLIIIHAVLSWIPEMSWRYPRWTRLLNRIVQPVLEPFRRMIPPRKTGGIDISPAVAIIALGILQRILAVVLRPLR